MEIQRIHIGSRELISVYGFGSFFRDENSNDCDLLLVITNDSLNLGEVHAMLNKKFSSLGNELSLEFDLTILTERENMRKPLLEHDKLVPISEKCLTR